MTKLFFALLTTLFITNDAWCMKRPRNETPDEQASKKICSSEPSYQYVPAEILLPAFIDLFKKNGRTSFKVDSSRSFKKGISWAKTIQNNICNISLINKDFYRQVNLPHNIRSIVNNADPTGCRRGYLANIRPLPAVKNYIQQSEKLHININVLTHDQIKKLVEAGADANYCCYFANSKYCYSVLMHTRSDYDKTALLLELGADPNMSNGVQGPSPFQYALFTKDIALLKLFLAHKPRLRHVKAAVQTKNDEIITLVLQDKNIPITELNEALVTIIVETFNLSHAKLLLDAGADPNTALLKAFTKFTISLYDFGYHSIARLILDMIDLLCTYGAYDDTLYAAALAKNAPQQLIDSLEKGRRIMVEKKRK